MTPCISVRHVNHSFGTEPLRKQILFDVSTEVFGGEIVIAMGPSGSGKTTLLTLMGALRSVQDGSLTTLGHELNGASRQTLIEIRRNIGFVFQAHNLLDALTACQNVQMRLQLERVPPHEARRRAVEMLDAVGLGERVDHLPRQLSGGQKQRVAIARALVSRGRGTDRRPLSAIPARSVNSGPGPAGAGLRRLAGRPGPQRCRPPPERLYPERHRISPIHQPPVDGDADRRDRRLPGAQRVPERGRGAPHRSRAPESHRPEKQHGATREESAS